MSPSLQEKLDEIRQKRQALLELDAKMSAVRGEHAELIQEVEDLLTNALGDLPRQRASVEAEVRALEEAVKPLLRSQAGDTGLSLAAGPLRALVSKATSVFVASPLAVVETFPALGALRPIVERVKPDVPLRQALGEWADAYLKGNVTDEAKRAELRKAIHLEKIPASTPQVSFEWKEEEATDANGGE